MSVYNLPAAQTSLGRISRRRCTRSIHFFTSLIPAHSTWLRAGSGRTATGGRCRRSTWRRQARPSVMRGTGFDINILAAYDADDELLAAHVRAQREGCNIRDAFFVADVDRHPDHSPAASQRVPADAKPIRPTDLPDHAAQRPRQPPPTSRLGPGQLWEAAAAALVDKGVVPSMNSRVDEVRFNDGAWTVTLGNGTTASGDAVFSSMPLRVLVQCLQPATAATHPGHRRSTHAPRAHHRRRRRRRRRRGASPHPLQLGVYPRQRFRGGRIPKLWPVVERTVPADWEGTYLAGVPHQPPRGTLDGERHELGRLVARDIAPSASPVHRSTSDSFARSSVPGI